MKVGATFNIFLGLFSMNLVTSLNWGHVRPVAVREFEGRPNVPHQGGVLSSQVQSGTRAPLDPSSRREPTKNLGPSGPDLLSKSSPRSVLVGLGHSGSEAIRSLVKAP